MRTTFKAIAIGACLLATTTAAAQERFIEHSGALTLTYRCYHASVAARMPADAESLLRLGDYDAGRRGLTADERGQFKGYARAMAEQDVRTHGSPTAAYNALGCNSVAQRRIVAENPYQRIPPGAERR